MEAQNVSGNLMSDLLVRVFACLFFFVLLRCYPHTVTTQMGKFSGSVFVVCYQVTSDLLWWWSPFESVFSKKLSFCKDKAVASIIESVSLLFDLPLFLLPSTFSSSSVSPLWTPLVEIWEVSQPQT